MADEFYKSAVALVAFRGMGLCYLAFFLFSNPLVVPPRFWDATVIARSVSIDAALLIIAVGLFGLRRWAACLACIVAVTIAVGTADPGTPMGLLTILLLFSPCVMTWYFWQLLVPANKRRDLLLVLGSAAVSAAVHLAAFLTYGPRPRP